MFAYNGQLLVETKYNIYKIYIKYTLLEYKKHFDDHAVTGCNKAFFFLQRNKFVKPGVCRTDFTVPYLYSS